MINRLRRAIQQQTPIDIYFSISIDDQPNRCLLYYPCFMVTEVNETDKTFSGFTVQQRMAMATGGDREVLTTDTIDAICNIYSPYL